MKIDIEVDEHGMGQILLDGQDVSNAVHGIEISTRPGSHNEVRLLLHGEISMNTRGAVTFQYPKEGHLNFRGKAYEDD